MFVAVFGVVVLSCSSSGNKVITQDMGTSDTTVNPHQILQRNGEKASTWYYSEATSKTGWTTFRGSPGRTGRAAIKGPRRPNLKWVFRTGGRIYGDVAVTPENTIYVPSHDHHLYAVNSHGRELWSYDAGGKIWTSPAVGKDGTIYFGSDDDQLTALNPRGQLLWSFRTSKAPENEDRPEAGRWDVDTSPVLLADGTIVFGCHFDLYAVRPNGILRWYFKAGTGQSKIFSSPTLGQDGTIYFGTQGDHLFALDQSAKVLWYLKTGGDNDATPAVDNNGTVYFGSDDGKLRAVLSDGNQKWEKDLFAPIRAPVAIGRDGVVLVPTYAQKPFLAAIDSQTGSEKWRYHIEPGEGSFYGIQSGALVDSEGYIYFGGRDHYITCLSPGGTLVWRYKTDGQVDSSPVLGPDGTLYVGSDDKRLYAFGP
jgi:outer membrane protein assembly factor BamB